ncbi:MAG: DUF418 domain-containing protein [Verrucomicrobiae bacterium]|nr:DUF418 domain-containing protein [Verrucomicrobiae bacterium]
MQAVPDIPPVIGEFRAPPPAPVAPAERIETLDVLRGFALLGILLVNMALFSWPCYDLFMANQPWTTRADVAADWLVRIFAEGKFISLFSFLFGLGMAIQMERAAARGAGFVGRYARRLLALLAIGLAHAFLIWEGDILVVYALFGFLLLAFRYRRPTTLLVWAGICLVLPVLIYALLAAMMTLATFVPGAAESIQKELAATNAWYEQASAENLRAFAHGNLAEVFAQRARNVLFLYQYVWYYAPMFFAMFLFGLYAGRRRLLHDLEANLGFIRRTLGWGLALGLPANLIYTVTYAVADPASASPLWVVSAATLAVGGPALCLAYAAGLTLLLRRPGAHQWLHPLAAVGRMALTNYLLQSVVCTTLFYSYGLGWYGSVGRAPGVVLALIIYAAQIPFSVWWLKRFRFGPMEWLWRTLTYARRQPMRL